MQPALRFGQEVLISSVPYFFRKPATGDIIVFKKKKKLFIKRIHMVTDDTYEVRGDNSKDSLDSDSFGNVLKQEIVGKLIYTFS